jgi:adenine/guanine phosphoribosyltransferase-like PRPP-binding protein
LQKGIITTLPVIKIEKIPKIHGNLIVHQKSLKSTLERVENARETIFINDNQKYNKVLLIDDFISSGSTLNEIAKKLKYRKQASKVIGSGVAASINSFEVINEV